MFSSAIMYYMVSVASYDDFLLFLGVRNLSSASEVSEDKKFGMKYVDNTQDN